MRRSLLLLVVLPLMWGSACAQCPGILPSFSWSTSGTAIFFENVTPLPEGVPGVDLVQWQVLGDTFTDSPFAYGFPNANVDTVTMTLHMGPCQYSVVGVVAHGGPAEVCDLSISSDFTSEQTMNNLVQFSDASDVAGATAYAFWAYGDEAVDPFVDSPSHFYALPGAYDVTHSMVTVNQFFTTACTAGRARKILVDGNTSTCDTSLFLSLGFVEEASNAFTFSMQAVPLQSGVSVFSASWLMGDQSIAMAPMAEFYYQYAYSGAYQVCVSAGAYNDNTEDSCYAMACETVQAFVPLTVVAEKEADALRAWPNPCTTDLFVGTGDHARGEWCVLDMHGRTRLTGTWSSTGFLHVDVRDLRPGTFVLRLNDERGQRQLRFVTR